MTSRRRPAIPKSYGIAEGTDGMLTWEEAEAVLSAAEIYWVASSLPDGTPHLIPIWGAWVDGAGYIEGGDETRWARNLAGGGDAHVGADGRGIQVMVRGRAEKVTVDDATQVAIADGYAAKYPYRPQGDEFWRITPDRVLAWSTSTVGAFAETPTEFGFGATP